MSSCQGPPDEALGHCLVTGAAGFLGRHLVHALLRDGYRVRALIHNRKLSFEDPRLEIVHGAIEDGARMIEVCANIDSVFHAAASMTLFGCRAVPESYRHASYATNV